MIKTPEAEKTGKCLSRKNLSDWSKKLQHWSYRICSRIVHSPFLKESCRVLSYKSKIDLTGAHCRWILKVKVKSTFFHRFSAFSNICCYQFLFVFAPFWIFYSESTWRWSPRRPNLQIISTSSEASNFRTSVVHVGTGHVKLRIRLLDHIGSCSKQVTFSWQFGFRKSIIAVLHPFGVGSFRNPSNTCMGQDVKGEPTYTNHPGPAPDPRFKRNQMVVSKTKMFQCSDDTSKLANGSQFASGNSDDRFRFGLTLWKKADWITSTTKIPPVLKVKFCQWIGLNLISSCVTCFEHRAVLCLPSRPWDFMRLSTKPISLFVIASPSTIKVFPMISEEICRNLQKFMLRSPTSDVERESINVSKKVWLNHEVKKRLHWIRPNLFALQLYVSGDFLVLVFHGFQVSFIQRLASWTAADHWSWRGEVGD